LKHFVAAAGAAALCFASWQPVVAAAQRTKSAPQAYAVVAGTVFQADGRVLRGAAVTLKENPEDGSTSRRKALAGTSDGRGEFAFRVPAIPMRYTVIVEAAGYVSQEKQVSVAGEQSADVYFQMEPAASKR
jgi:hypothetical protein